jgi:protein-S-isoprenylcysteine O-methyltransferase Ste14
MDMYGRKSPSIPQKLIIVAAELGLVTASYAVLFGPALKGVRAFAESPHFVRNTTLFAFNVVVVARFMLTLFVFAERRIPWEEAASIPLAFALYLFGFPLLARPARVDFGALELAGIVLFLAGSFVNTYAEHQRRRYKLRPENEGKLYTGGFFSLTMHPNYFGDLLWVSGYACVTHNVFAWLVPAFLFGFFYFYNIPKLDRYLEAHYGAAFSAYARRTKRLIPFLL